MRPFQISASPLTTDEEKDQLRKKIDTLFSYILAIFQQANGSALKERNPEWTLQPRNKLVLNLY